MSLTIELTPAEETALQAAAAREGLDVTTFARQQIVRATHSASSPSHDVASAHDVVSLLQASGVEATRAARESLHAQGIGYVIAQPGGAVVERLPDGTTTVLHTAGTVAE